MSTNQLDLGRHQELAEFLRSRRARLSPEQLGFPKGTRRRTPGLRREEVAALAGVSLEWYTWLEQGRDINVSVQLLESLVRALQLDENERTHLFLLALRQPPPVKTIMKATAQTTIDPNLQDFLTKLGPIPACVIDSHLDIIAWNRALFVSLGVSESTPEAERNLVWRFFTSPYLTESWEEHGRLLIALFRTEYGRFIDDPWWANQIAELSEISPMFRELWARHDVLGDLTGRKTIHHPVAGDLTFDYLLLNVADSSDLRLLVYNPVNGTTEKIKQLLDRSVFEEECLPEHHRRALEVTL